MKGKVNKITPIVAILKYSICGMLLFKNTLVWVFPSMWTSSGIFLVSQVKSKIKNLTFCFNCFIANKALIGL